jgi:hypothetical protein
VVVFCHACFCLAAVPVLPVGVVLGMMAG